LIDGALCNHGTGIYFFYVVLGTTGEGGSDEEIAGQEYSQWNEQPFCAYEYDAI